MINRILVAVDGSDRAPMVFAAAVEIAAHFRAALRPFRAVMVPPEFPAAAAGSRSDPLAWHLLETAEEELAQLIPDAPPGVLIEPPVVRIGQAWRLILAVADEIDADLVVIGSHGYHGLDRILGTTAARVANVSTRNVLVVHDHQDRAAVPEPTASPYRRRAS
ncbi:MAG TPA: universal stress protein [Polyangiaceae bacterium]